MDSKSAAKGGGVEKPFSAKEGGSERPRYLKRRRFFGLRTTPSGWILTTRSCARGPVRNHGIKAAYLFLEDAFLFRE
jgi:hypothetical protein